MHTNDDSKRTGQPILQTTRHILFYIILLHDIIIVFIF